MRRWSVAVLMTRRLADGGIELLVVPVFVAADSRDAALDRVTQDAMRPGYDVRGCAIVEAVDGACGEGLTWTVGAWVSMA